jgi:hypothetical protein
MGNERRVNPKGNAQRSTPNVQRPMKKCCGAWELRALINHQLKLSQFDVWRFFDFAAPPH